MKKYIWLGLMTALSCTSPDLGLDVGEDQDEWSELRRRMNVTAVDSQGVEQSVTPAEFAVLVGMDCSAVANANDDALFSIRTTMPSCAQAQLPNDPLLPSYNTSGIESCVAAACEVAWRTCVAHRLMEVADSPTPGLKVDGMPVPPQDQSTQAGLHEVALQASREAIITAGTALRLAAGRTVDGGGNCPATELDGYINPNEPISDNRVTIGESLSFSLVENYNLQREAVEKLAEDNVAIADESYSVENSLSRATRRAFNAPVLSRGATAHTLFGAPPDMVPTADPMSADPPFRLDLALPTFFAMDGSPAECQSRNDATEAAIAAIREVGLNPIDIRDDAIDIDHLIAIQDGILGDHASLVERLEVTVDGDLPEVADEVYGTLGINRAAFISARAYIRAELDSFPRDEEIALPPRELVSTLEDPKRFAATATPPARRSQFALAAVVNTAPPLTTLYQHPSDLTADGGLVHPDYARRSVAATMDFALSAAVDLVHDGATALPAKVKHGLAFLVAAAENERPARVEVSAGNGSLVVNVLGQDAADIVMVRGESALQCATSGTVEGVVCDVDNYLLPLGMPITPSRESGFVTGTKFSFSGDDAIATNNSAVYFVLKRDGEHFHPLGGAPVQVAGDDLGTQAGFVSLPNFNEHIGRLLDRTSTCRPAVNCAGINTRDHLLPLENELSEDGDAFENSWRTYLRLARQAADEADRLGTDLLDSGLSMDMRAEAALDQLAIECGTSIDIDGLMPDAAALQAAPACGAMGECMGDLVCHIGHCVADPVDALLRGTMAANDDENMGRLRACLGDENETDGGLVSLGTKPLCVWRSTTNHNEICREIEGLDLRCPFFLDEFHPAGQECSGGTCVPADPASCDLADLAVAGIEVVPTKSLQLFESETTGGATGNVRRGEDCVSLRVIRNPNSSEEERVDARHQIDERRDFNFEDFRAVASTLNVRWTYDNHFALTRGGSIWETYSGSAFEPADSDAGRPWPCRADDPADNPTFPGVECESDDFASFFCQPLIDCDDHVQRHFFVRRLSAAVITASRLGGVESRVAVPAAANDCTLPQDWGNCDQFRDTTNTGFLIDGATCGDGRRYYNNTSAAPYLTEQQRMGGRSRGDSRLFAGFEGRPIPDPSVRTSRIDHHNWLLAFGGEQESIRHGAHHSNHLLDPTDWDPDYSECYEGLPVGANATVQAGRDAFELVCEAGRPRHDGTILDSCGEPAVLQSVDDLEAFKTHMACLANTIESEGERLVFSGLPKAAADAITRPDAFGSVPANGGNHGQAITRLRATLREYRPLQRNLAQSLRHFSEQVGQLRSLLHTLSIDLDLTSVRLMSTISSQIAACGSALSNAGIDPSGAGAAAFTCANSAMQIGLAVMTQALEASKIDDQQSIAMSQFMQSFYSAQEGLRQALDEMRQATESVHSNLLLLESSADSARRAIARATFADSDSTGRFFRVNTVMRRRNNTLAIRYERARQYAVRMAALARTALEQRLGTRLEDLPNGPDGRLSLVDHPSEWANTLCMATGIDYGRIRDARETDFESFEDAYIGDYVRQLEAVVESYRLDFPFSDGDDTSVISLRDEVFNVRENCDAEPADRRNLVDQSTNFAASPTDEAFGWETNECEPVDDGTGNLISLDCVRREPLFATSTDPAPFISERAGASSYRIHFGGENVSDFGAASPTLSTDSFDDNTTLRQQVALTAGQRYRVSYYARRIVDDMDHALLGPLPNAAIQVVDETGTPLVTPPTVAPPNPLSWTRYTYDIDTIGAVDGAIYYAQVTPDYGSAAMPPNQVIDVAGFMVEHITDGMTTEPTSFEDSHVQYLLCEDTDGSSFRNRHWSRACELHCPVATSSCEPELKVRECFWETSFGISMADIENRNLIHAGGFARGNYNYRADSLGVNFVGTNIRDCENAELPSTCYSTGSIPFSLYHTGSFNVRNHQGSDSYEAPLFNGRIEHGRGLAAERYITNPLSSADRALIDPYYHREFRGRPLTGTYTLRLWEEPGIRFDNIEDVQIVLNYRYWTRLD